MKYCRNCGAQIDSGQKFCKKCGNRIGDESKHPIETKIKPKTNKMQIIIIVLAAVIVVAGAAYFLKNDFENPVEDNKAAVVSKKPQSKDNKAKDSKSAVNKSNKDSKVEDNKSSEVKKENYYVSKYKSREYIIPTSGSVKLGFRDLDGYTSEELLIARNELYARHGYKFDDKPNLKAYFESKSWYIENQSYDGKLPGDVEKYNLSMINEVGFEKQATDKNSPVNSDYVFPDSSISDVSVSRILSLNDWELVVARNEIFARYGLEFSSSDLSRHFNSKSWYKMNPSVGNDVKLNDVENKNISKLVDEQVKRIEIKLGHDLPDRYQ